MIEIAKEIETALRELLLAKPGKGSKSAAISEELDEADEAVAVEE